MDRPNSNRVNLPWWLRSGPHMPPAWDTYESATTEEVD
jgi:hypothetical protein